MKKEGNISASAGNPISAIRLITPISSKSMEATRAMIKKGRRIMKINAKETKILIKSTLKKRPKTISKTVFRVPQIVSKKLSRRKIFKIKIR